VLLRKSVVYRVQITQVSAISTVSSIPFVDKFARSALRPCFSFFVGKHLPFQTRRAFDPAHENNQAPLPSHLSGAPSLRRRRVLMRGATPGQPFCIIGIPVGTTVAIRLSMLLLTQTLQKR
jgi:hypothetical protein